MKSITSVTIDTTVLANARSCGINVSRATENALKLELGIAEKPGSQFEEKIANLKQMNMELRKTNDLAEEKKKSYLEQAHKFRAIAADYKKKYERAIRIR